MLLNLLMVSYVVICCFLAYYGFTKVLNSPIKKRLKQYLTVKELGALEGNISNLREVFVIADQVEKPSNELYKSVRKNIKNGVKYIFLISESTYIKEMEGYITLFQAFSEINESSYNIDINSSVKIFRLNFDWDDYPYVFYRYFEEKTCQQKTFAYMGTELKDGISDQYEKINPIIALKILNLATQGVDIPENEKISKDELYDVEPMIIPTKIRMFPKTKSVEYAEEI